MVSLHVFSRLIYSSLLSFLAVNHIQLQRERFFFRNNRTEPVIFSTYPHSPCHTVWMWLCPYKPVCTLLKFPPYITSALEPLYLLPHIEGAKHSGYIMQLFTVFIPFSVPCSHYRAKTQPQQPARLHESFTRDYVCGLAVVLITLF